MQRRHEAASLRALCRVRPGVAAAGGRGRDAMTPDPNAVLFWRFIMGLVEEADAAMLVDSLDAWVYNHGRKY